MKRYLTVVTLLFVMLALSSSACTSREVAKGNINAPMPAFQGLDAKGKAINSSSYAGKVLIIDFWATWCPPCRQEIPGFISLQKKYGSKGLQIIGFSCDKDAQTHNKFIKDANMNYPSMLVTDKNGSVVRQKFEKVIGDIEGIPTTIIVNKQGKIVYKHVGYADEATFEAIIKPLL